MASSPIITPMETAKIYKSEKADQVHIKLAPGMKARLEALANANKRTVNSEVAYVLEEYLAQYGVQDARQTYKITEKDAAIFRAIEALSPNKRRALLELLLDG